MSYNARNDELQRLFSHNAVTSVANSQRLARPWKIRKRDENNKRKHELRMIIEQQAKYIESSTQTSPPSTKPQAIYSSHPSLNPTRTYRNRRGNTGSSPPQSEKMRFNDLSITQQYAFTEDERNLCLGSTINVTDVLRCDLTTVNDNGVSHSEADASSQI